MIKYIKVSFGSIIGLAILGIVCAIYQSVPSVSIEVPVNALAKALLIIALLGLTLIVTVLITMFTTKPLSHPYGVLPVRVRKKLFIGIMNNSRLEAENQVIPTEQQIHVRSYNMQLKRYCIYLLSLYPLIVIFFALLYLSLWNWGYYCLSVIGGVTIEKWIAALILSVLKLVGETPHFIKFSKPSMYLITSIETLSGILILGVFLTFIIILPKGSSAIVSTIFHVCKANWKNLKSRKKNLYDNYKEAVEAGDIDSLKKMDQFNIFFESAYNIIIHGLGKNAG